MLLAAASFAYILYQRPSEIHRQRLAEAQVKYKARAELNEARYMEKSDLLEITLGHMNQGIAFVNADGKLLIFNKRAVEYSGIDEAQFAQPEFALPVDVRAIFAEQWKKGEFGPNGELLPEDIRQYFLTGTGTLPKSYVRRRPNGSVIEVRIEPLPSGGMVQSFTDITDLVAAIRSQGVKAVFSESSLPPKTAEAIASEAGVQIIEGEDALYGDSLGPKGSEGDTYLKMERHNTSVIVSALRGGGS